ncbi:PilZ domain-containing protein [Phytohalomonas tamaricis]|uniref:PilZ domain-containing protein n=1 Tax=Phytohalomonas tamaricis TaxID=2081032 RepID=UPI000D0B6D66|nr:PilZ domain-containing protein [Phytohalomonas tamaricis]
MTAQKSLALTFDNSKTLLAAYMPVFERGGIFVPTRERFELGQRVNLRLRLPGEQEYISAVGEVAWVSPAGASGQRAPGIGVHFDAGEQALRTRIENHLAGMLGGDHASYTL